MVQTKRKIFESGKEIIYTLRKGSGMVTQHIYIEKNGVNWLHFMPSENKGFSKCFKNCGSYGWLPMGEVAINFEDITLNRIYLG